MILAAGCGKRLHGDQVLLPKTLISLSGKPLLHHILRTLSLYPNAHKVIVSGFQAEKMEKFLKASHDDSLLVHNPNYSKGNLLTLLCARPFLSDSFFILNADHLFERDILDRTFASRSQVTIVCDFDRTLADDEMKITTNQRATLVQMSKTLFPHEGGYIGITQVPRSKIGIYWSAAEHVLKKEGEGIAVEAVLNELVRRGETVDILDVSGHKWFEVDTEEDLRRAQKLIKAMNVWNL